MLPRYPVDVQHGRPLGRSGECGITAARLTTDPWPLPGLVSVMDQESAIGIEEALPGIGELRAWQISREVRQGGGRGCIACHWISHVVYFIHINYLN